MINRTSTLPPIRAAWLGLLLLLTAAGWSAAAETFTPRDSGRTTLSLDADWRFNLGDVPNAMTPGFDDSGWRRLNVPHDWSIEGPLGPEYASGSGFAPGGIGWYRKAFRVAPSASNKVVAVEFDGVYNQAQVWINGHLVGSRPYGYSSFECDLTPHLKFNAENVLAVRVDHTKFSDSRWYTGSGIYRHVRLRCTEPVRIAQWGTFVTTPEVGANSARVRIETEIRNSSPSSTAISVESQMIGPDGTPAGTHSIQVRIGGGTNSVLVQEIPLSNPQRWSVDTPHLYSVRQRIQAGAEVLDETTTSFGIRTFRFDANQGFFLNGTPMKLKGVCLHHDAGALGAAVPVEVWERRLRVLKTIGVNAIRTSHNPPAPELLDLCDRLGFLVQDEALDEFTPPKNKWVQGWNAGQPSRFGYGEVFDEWAVRDVEDMVRRDRNHPSIVMWSIGNEIDYANDPFTHPVLGGEFRPDHPRAENLVRLAKPLIAAVKRFDTTRPVTAALATVAMSDAVGLGELLDVVGYNYQEQRYPGDHAKFPNRVIYGSENGHSFNAWAAVRDNEFISAQFLWTGVDYLGEAGRWPNHANGSGLLDLCGFKKPLAWYRQSLWSDEPMVYLCASAGSDNRGRGRLRAEESWNWSSNRTLTVRCFTTCPEVELSLNGTVIGSRRRADAVEGALVWEVPFQAGTLTAVGRDGSRKLAEFSLKTSGPASRVELLPETSFAPQFSKGISHIEYRITDDQGVRIPEANTEVAFRIDGPAELLGIENGDLNSVEDYKDLKHRAHRGRGLLILRTRPGAGPVTVTATAEGLRPATITVAP